MDAVKGEGRAARRQAGLGPLSASGTAAQDLGGGTAVASSEGRRQAPEVELPDGPPRTARARRARSEGATSPNATSPEADAGAGAPAARGPRDGGRAERQDGAGAARSDESGQAIADVTVGLDETEELRERLNSAVRNPTPAHWLSPPSAGAERTHSLDPWGSSGPADRVPVRELAPRVAGSRARGGTVRGARSARAGGGTGGNAGQETCGAVAER